MPQSKANSEGFQVFGGYPQLMLRFPDADMEYDVRLETPVSVEYTEPRCDTNIYIYIYIIKNGKTVPER